MEKTVTKPDRLFCWLCSCWALSQASNWFLSGCDLWCHLTAHVVLFNLVIKTNTTLLYLSWLLPTEERSSGNLLPFISYIHTYLLLSLQSPIQIMLWSCWLDPDLHLRWAEFSIYSIHRDKYGAYYYFIRRAWNWVCSLHN